jgi:thiol-disulfide isomerase/thioredoxin
MKRSVIVIGVLVLIAAAMVVVLMSRDDTPEPVTRASLPPTETAGQPQAQVAGAYVDYREEVLADTSGDRVLFFHAPWCPQCRSIEQGIKTDGVPAGWTVIKVDYDSNQELRKKYGVTQQTTFVKVDGDGKKTASYVAYENPRFATVRDTFLLR